MAMFPDWKSLMISLTDLTVVISLSTVMSLDEFLQGGVLSSVSWTARTRLPAGVRPISRQSLGCVERNLLS
jgi:hypothetical protein